MNGREAVDDYANIVCSGLLISGLYDEFALYNEGRCSRSVLHLPSLRHQEKRCSFICVVGYFIISAYVLKQI